MDIKEHLDKMKIIHKNILDFIIDTDNEEENFENMQEDFKKYKIAKDTNELRLLLHLINNISIYHNRYAHFLNKIEKILLLFRNELQQSLSNYEIINIFKDNMKILLFLITNKIIVLNGKLAKQMVPEVKEDYSIYFFNEIKPFLTGSSKTELFEIVNKYKDFQELVNEGENENLFCSLIRNDLISEFIIYVNKHDLFLNRQIPESSFETHNFLWGKKLTLIEYAAFFGSIQIFRYLYQNGVKLTPSLWVYAIHGASQEITQILEDEKIQPVNNSYFQCLEEAIKCHHNGIVNYIIRNFLQNSSEVQYFKCLKSLIYYNYELLDADDIIVNFNRNSLFFFARYDYYFLVEHILKSRNFDVNFQTRLNDFDGNKITYISTPFLISITEDNINITELLLKCHGLDIRSKYYKCKWGSYEEEGNALFEAINKANFRAIKILISQTDIDINERNRIKKYENENYSYIIEESTPLIEAIQKNSDIIKLLLSHQKIDVNLEKNIYSPIKNHYIDSFIPFKDPKCQTTALYEAIKAEFNIAVNILLNHQNIDVNKFHISRKSNGEIKKTALYKAISKNNISVAQALLSHKKIDVNTQMVLFQENTICNANILHYAIIKQNINIIKFLLSQPQIRVNDKMIMTYKREKYIEMTGLCWAVKNNCNSVVKLLLNCPEIDVNCFMIEHYKTADIFKMPILHVAINSFLNDEILGYLISNPKIDINLKSFKKTSKINKIIEEEETALNYALVNSNVPIVKLLFTKNDIDIYLKSKRKIITSENFFVEENSPLDNAISMKNPIILKLFIEKMKKDGNLTDEKLNEIMNSTNDWSLKSLIYNEY